MTDRVDAFIAEESARPAAEDEAANWVPVPWQDVGWLVANGALVENSHYRMQNGTSGIPDMPYRADRRTFPAGYDPTKPRWVDIDWRQVRRLEDSGAHVQVKGGFAVENGVATVVFCDRYSGDAGTDGHDGEKYRVDIHTLPPGVPLHVEPPKPEPRPCTREFALEHPKESECRFRHDGLDWDSWCSMTVYAGSKRLTYEFRTTAREPEKPDVSWFHDARQYTEPPTVLSEGVWKIVATRIA